MRTLRTILTTLVAATLALEPAFAFAEATTPSKTTPPVVKAYDDALKTMRDKVGALRGLGVTLRKFSEEPIPPKLTADQVAEVKKYNTWLDGASGRVTKLATSWEQKVDELRVACEKDSSCKREAIAKSMGEVNMSFNLQYLQLQSAMQDENRSYTAISNIMKTKHETVKNSISNVR
jgi:hypothetical protein